MYVLANAQALARENPGTFSAPDADELAEIRPGDFVKVAAQFDPMAKASIVSPLVRRLWEEKIGKHAAGRCSGERFWIKVTAIADNGTLTGEINNDLVYTENHGLLCGDTISFRPENVYQIHRA